MALIRLQKEQSNLSVTISPSTSSVALTTILTSLQQCLNNQSHFDSGTAATIYLVKNPSTVSPNNQAYNAQFQTGSKNPITYVDILKLNSAAAPRLHERRAYILLSILLQFKPFDLSTYEYCNDVALRLPPFVLQLPTG
jgi:hypothetical protein